MGKKQYTEKTPRQGVLQDFRLSDLISNDLVDIYAAMRLNNEVNYVDD